MFNHTPIEESQDRTFLPSIRQSFIRPRTTLERNPTFLPCCWGLSRIKDPGSAFGKASGFVAPSR